MTSHDMGDQANRPDASASQPSGLQAPGHQAPAQPSSPSAAQPGQQPAEGAAHPTEPFWYGQTAALPYVPASPQSPAGPSAAVLTQPRAGSVQPARPRRMVELVGVALLAAILASGTTYAVTDMGDTHQATTSASSNTLGSTPSNAAPVIQASASAPDWSVTAAAVSPSVVAITVTTGQGEAQGSGVIIDGKGHIVTNNHVVASLGSGAKIVVTLNDKRSYPATVVGTDSATDLAVVKLQSPPDDLTAISLGDATKLKVGQPVMAVGNPLGLAGTVTTGIVSALNRPVTTSTSSGGSQQDPFGQQTTSEPVVTNAVQTSAAINPGNSGGALVNASGQLIGINSSIASVGASSDSSSESGNIGIGFAIPVNEVTSIANQLITSGKAQHAYLGVTSRDADVKDGSATRAAAEIGAVTAGTPAAKAGLKAGDAIIAVDGASVDSSLSLVAQIRERGVGDKATLTVVRNGAKRDVSVTLETRPSSQQ